MTANAESRNLSAVAGDGAAVSQLDVSDRAQFIMRTYGHLLGAVMTFIAIELLLFATGLAVVLGKMVLGGGPLVWLGVLGGFMIGGWVATNVAHSAQSKPAQYAALFAYVLVEALIFCPLLLIAAMIAPIEICASANR